MDFAITRHVHRLNAENDRTNYWYVVKSASGYDVVKALRTETGPTGWLVRSVTKSTAELRAKQLKERDGK